MNSGVDLYNQAKKIIPGGNQLLSKRPEMFLPDQWPSYFKKANGVEIWDMDNNHYFDMSIMGIGTCSLGYANEDVNKAVVNAIDNGSMATLNSFEEVELAEKLIQLHPGMEMARFSRTGGEACAIAIRIARAASGKTKVAVCGYHGWHDWYLAANLSSKNNLQGLLLPGLEPNGVPLELMGTTLPFHYGNIDELENIVATHGDELGVIFMEVQRGKEINVEFLHKVKNISKQQNVVLVFDEISSGFRMSIGGMYKNYDLEPDMVLLGKALGNGYAISAVLGKKEVMESAQSTFISSSLWTERIGYVAALETLRQFEEKKVIDYLKNMGGYFRDKMAGMINSIDIKIKIEGMLTIPIIVIEEEDPLLVKTIFTQEMLKKGFLASNVIYLSLAHTEDIIDTYVQHSKEVLEKIASVIHKNNLKSLLEGPKCHSGFQRLT